MATKIEPLMTIADLEAMPEDGNRYEVIEEFSFDNLVAIAVFRHRLKVRDCH